MKLNLKDIKGKSINVGDTVETLYIRDSSGCSSDMFGTEPQNSGWVEILELEKLKGKVIFDQESLAFVVSDGNRKVYLSEWLRSVDLLEGWERMDKEDWVYGVEDLNLASGDLEYIFKYLVKIEDE